LAFDTALEDEGGADADTAHEDDHFWINFGLNFGFGVEDQRGYEDLVDGLFPGGGRLGSCGMHVRFCADGPFAHFLSSRDLADFGLWCRNGLQVASAAAGAVANAVQLAVEEQNITCLRDQDALTG